MDINEETLFNAIIDIMNFKIRYRNYPDYIGNKIETVIQPMKVS